MGQAEPQLTEKQQLLELHAQLMQCESQRNEALNQVVVKNGQLATAGAAIQELQQQLATTHQTLSERDTAIAEGLAKIAELTKQLKKRPAPRRKAPAKSRKR